ncbi:hypothetical protein EDM56_09170 [Brevibacillus fluminis]|uniref:JAB domain-containing protein n=1 Tax=Brevibacillus fluminis TaxID=511487 RepID=A0A3M8DRH7_9BACL|nr:Mov34/MPN/PAD-1 family protein [Brevibacillus fluminis]RNB90652.1 hypothetical protein EDM56_09170 [Brevibacillus fluminis]
MSTLYLSPRAHRQIQQAVSRNPGVETGGIMMGYQLNARDWLVTYASEPGPKAVHQPLTVVFDDSYLNNLVTRLQARSTRRWQYIGDWHSHTVRNLSPSRADKHTIATKAFEAKYGSKSPIMLIVGLGKQQQIQAKGFILAGSLRPFRQVTLYDREKQGDPQPI